MLLFPKHIAFCVLAVVGVIFLPSCRDARRETSSPDTQSHPLSLRYATHFGVEETSYGYLATVYAGGSDQQVTFRYALVRGDSAQVPDDACKINIPVERLGTNSGTLFGFLELLGVMDKMVATCDAKFIFSDEIRGKVSRGDIISLGSSFDINGERLLFAHPDVLFLSDLRDDPHANVCPVVHNFEWKESSALARTEWIKFISLFFDRYAMADSIFQTIEQRYVDLKEMVDTVQARPTLFSAGSYGDTWYMTGGEGFMSKLYQDAGGNYLLADTMVPTVTCGTEWLLAHYSEADFWMNCGTVRLEDLDPRLSQMKSYKNGNLFHFQKREKTTDGLHITDFYESAVARPDVVLADLISVLHPEVMPEHETVYLGRCVKSGEGR